LIYYPSYHKIDLSEQFVIDCGSNYQSDIHGCSGGSLGGAFNFLYNNELISE